MSTDFLSFFDGKSQDEWADEAGGMEVFPPGWHEFTVFKVDGPKPNKNNNGMLLEVHFEHKNGGKLRNWYNLSNVNETAAKIGKAELAKLFSSAGRKLEKGQNVLPGSRVDLRLTQEDNTYTTADGEKKTGKQNKIKDSAPIGTKSSKKQAQPVQQQQQQQGSNPNGGKSWY